jgi:hypothetical protein
MIPTDSRRTALRRALPVLLAGMVLLAGACSQDSKESSADSLTGDGGSETSMTTASGDGQSSGASGSMTGTAKLVVDGSETYEFTLEPCVSGTDRSIQGAGASEDGAWKIKLDVADGSGEVDVVNGGDMTVEIDGETDDLKVSKDGTFTASGSGTDYTKERTFELTGTCGQLNWR